MLAAHPRQERREKCARSSFGLPTQQAAHLELTERLRQLPAERSYGREASVS
jgi:hypothetical protein